MVRLILFFMLMPMAIYCQNTDSPNKSKFSIGITFSPDYCYRILKSNDSDSKTIEYRDSIEVPKFGFTTGFAFLYNVNNRFNIEAGLLFSDKGEKSKIDLGPNLLSDPSQPIKVSATNSYQYLDIPIKANYSIIDKRLRLFISAGISTNVFLIGKETFIAEYEDGSTKKRSHDFSVDFSKINFAALVGLGLDYDLTNKVRIRIEPIYRRSINSIIDAPIKGYLYSVGLNAGVFVNI